ncbi:LEA type 2 family protein [Psychromonas sp. KJ10-10]|uniref:LEA type 2 family protein n=1 Tax=Psychromonas sp. KJ10-10 TaxID=3391823 RepID=UPI0039B4FC68
MIKKILAITLLLQISACANLQQEINKFVKQPEVTYQSISVGKVSMEGIELNPTFKIDNNNSFAIPVDVVSYDFTLNNKKLLAGETQAIGSLVANNSKDVTLSIDLTQESIVSLQQLLFKDKKLDYQVKGSVKAMGLVVPFEKSDTLYVPDISIADVKIINASLSNLELLLSIDVNNQNSFALPLEALNYSVSTGSQFLFEGALNNQQISQGKNNIQLPLSIKLDAIFTSVFAILANPELPLHFEINSPLFSHSFDQSMNLTSFF